MSIINCAWYTAAFSYPLGDQPTETLTSLGDGTDETDNTAFYSKEHVVYAQGT